MPAITEVRSPNQPGKGDVSGKVVACLQSTSPARMGMREERKASEAEAHAIGMARRVIHLIPHRFTNVKNKTKVMATASTGRPGKYHCWMAADESSAVSPQVGTQPHQ